MHIKVIDHETYENEAGKRFVTSSRPTTEPPKGDWKNYGWHDVAGKWMPVEDLDKPFEMDI